MDNETYEILIYLFIYLVGVFAGTIATWLVFIT